MSSGSKIFSRYRSFGYVSNHVPLNVRYIEKRKENLVITCIGKSFLTFSYEKLRLLSISKPLPDDITCIAGDAGFVFTASNCIIHAWQGGTEIRHTYKGHEKPVHILLSFGRHLISVDETSSVKVWDIGSEELYVELPFNNENFCITAVVHPATYANKVVFGSEQGELQLWNLKTAKKIYTFEGWGSAITVLEQSPAVDVVAIGLADGRIILHNLKHDVNVVKFMQDWGPVTALSFRSDNEPILVSGSTEGHIAIWNLEEKRLQTQMRNAHHSSIAGIKFFPQEPLMVTNSGDNSLKIWIFDLSDGSARLLMLRDGHSGPPTKIRFYGNGDYILSAGEDSTLRMYSTINDLMHKSLGKAQKKKIKRKRANVLAEEAHLMPPVVEIAWDQTREKDWDNIAAVHRNCSVVTTWSFGRCTMGTYRLKHKDKSISNIKNIAKCVTLTSCGNFVIVGFQLGQVDKFNIQSGEFRGHYGVDKAHDGAVCGVAVDGLNNVVATLGMDKKIKFWDFKSRKFLSELKLERTINRCILHRDSALLALAMDDFSIQMLDLDTRRIVRKFIGCAAKITDFDFSADSRWLVAASIDSSISTWDIPSSNMVDCFLVDDICTSLSLSPSREFLATTHVDRLEVFLWVNKTIYTYVQLSPLPADYEPQLAALPDTKLGDDLHCDEHCDESLNEMKFKSPEQISDNLVTLSLLPESRWKNLLVLDLIKKRNKPKEPPKVPKAAPFFLPTVPGLEFKFALPKEDDESSNKSRILKSTVFQTRTAFGKKLEVAETEVEYYGCFEVYKQLSPTSLEVEIYTLAPEGGGSIELLVQFLKMLYNVLKTNSDYEIVEANLGLFIKIHGSLFATEPELYEVASELQQYRIDAWQRIQTLLLSCNSVTSFLRSAPI
ncbi:WD repeat-containing protein 36 [Chamberlinius hualienensis]